MDPEIKTTYPSLIEHTIWLPGAIKDDNAIAAPLEEFFRDFDEHTLQQLEAHMPWLRDAYEEACPGEDDYDEDELAAGFFRAIGRGEASGWLVQVRIPLPPKDSWGSSWLIWAYGPTVQDALARAYLRGSELRKAEAAKVKP